MDPANIHSHSKVGNWTFRRGRGEILKSQNFWRNGKVWTKNGISSRILGEVKVSNKTICGRGINIFWSSLGFWQFVPNTTVIVFTHFSSFCRIWMYLVLVSSVFIYSKHGQNTTYARLFHAVQQLRYFAISWSATATK